MPKIACGTTTSSKLVFMREDETALERVEVLVTKRDWDVTDPEARAKVAEEEIGPLTDDYGDQNMMWYIDSQRNAAALLIFRTRGSPSRVPQAVL